MRITNTDVVPDIVEDGETTVKHCGPCFGATRHMPARVMLLSPSGARRMRLWECPNHPLPDYVTDQPCDRCKDTGLVEGGDSNGVAVGPVPCPKCYA